MLEVVESAAGGTYRAVYTVKFAGSLYVPHCFQEKSTQGTATPQPDRDLIRSRLKDADTHFKAAATQAKGARKDWNRIE